MRRVYRSVLHAPQAALLLVLLLISLLPSPATAQQIPRQHHAWARFAPGSWKLVRVVTENLDPEGQVVAASVIETKTTLKAADADGFTLAIQSTVELDGKRVVSPPQEVTQQYSGAVAGQTATSRRLADDAVTIGGKSFPCQVHQYEITGAGHKSVTRTHYSPDTAPYVLRRETTAIDSASNMVTSKVLVEVKQLDVPHMVCGQEHQAVRLRVQQKHAKGVETTEALSSLRVPGGVIWHDSTFVDASDVKLSRSKLELVDYHVVEREPPPQDTSALQSASCVEPVASPRWESHFAKPQADASAVDFAARRGVLCSCPHK